MSVQTQYLFQHAFSLFFILYSAQLVLNVKFLEGQPPYVIVTSHIFVVYKPLTYRVIHDLWTSLHNFLGLCDQNSSY